MSAPGLNRIASGIAILPTSWSKNPNSNFAVSDTEIPSARAISSAYAVARSACLLVWPRRASIAFESARTVAMCERLSSCERLLSCSNSLRRSAA